jgi:hypothetical protein
MNPLGVTTWIPQGEITAASLPIPERRLTVRQNGQCSGDLRDGHRDDPTPAIRVTARQ